MRTLIGLVLVLALLSPAAAAGGRYGGEDRGKPLQLSQVNTKWQQECASCHIAYAPGLLPAESWRKLMAGLDQHFGEDASLTVQENQEITAFLLANASNRWSSNTAPLRITESQWFKTKHNSREISADTWKRPSIKSRANCQACHVEAAKADFNEHRIKIPK